jgi:hypothetical protein
MCDAYFLTGFQDSKILSEKSGSKAAKLLEQLLKFKS